MNPSRGLAVYLLLSGALLRNCFFLHCCRDTVCLLMVSYEILDVEPAGCHVDKQPDLG